MPELLRSFAAMPAADQVLAIALGVTAAAWFVAVLWIVVHAVRESRRQPVRGEAVKAWRGVLVDHLYETCPWIPGDTRPLLGEVDPAGTDICGWCVRVWKARQG